MADDKNRWLTELRRELTARADNKSRLDALLEEQSARGWSGNFIQADFTGENEDITPALVANALGTIDAEDALWEGGHKTNVLSLYKRSA